MTLPRVTIYREHSSTPQLVQGSGDLTESVTDFMTICVRDVELGVVKLSMTLEAFSRCLTGETARASIGFTRPRGVDYDEEQSDG